jgi:hypothetical protein
MPVATVVGKALVMYARAIEDASSRLRELRQEEWEDLGLAALALSLALAATQARPALALPLFLGGVVVAVRGLRAFWRRWDLVDRLAGERDAYLIPEILARAEREATVERRQAYAARIRGELQQSVLAHRDRVMLVAEEMEALACELEDDELALDPACAVVCMRLLSDPSASPLLNLALPPEQLRSSVHQIRSGFRQTTT